MADFNRKYRNKPMIIGNAAIADREAHEASAIIQIEDHTGGFLTSRVTTVQRNAIIDPTNGLLLWNTDNVQLELYSSGAWAAVGSGGGSTFASLSDTAVGAQVIGQGLKWNGASWIPADFAIESTIQDPSGTTSVVATGTGIGTDAITFTIGGTTVGSVTTLGGLGITPKWTFGGIVDPDVYAGSPITTATRDATYTFGAASEGFMVYNDDIKEYEYHDGTAWKPMSGSVVPPEHTFFDWAATTAYVTKDTVLTPAGAIIRRIASNTSGAAFDATEAAKWDLVQNGPHLPAFPASTFIYAGQTMYGGTGLYQRLTSGFSLGSLAADVANWTLISNTIFESLFNANVAWGAPVGGIYTITLLAGTHLVPAPKSVQTWLDDGTSYIMNSADSTTVDKASGNVTINVSEVPDGRFAGRVTVQ
jgi:hypothetical protein